MDGSTPPSWDEASDPSDDRLTFTSRSWQVPPPPPGPRMGRWLLAAGLTLVVVGATLFGLLDSDGGVLEGSGEGVAAPLEVEVAGGIYAVWERRSDGTPVRWNPCEPIRWVWNPDSAPPSAFEDLLEAMDRMERHTGVPFQYLGETDERPSAERPPFQPDRYGEDRWAPVLVAWHDADDPEVPITTHNRAVAIPVSVGSGGDRVFVTAQIVFNDDTRLVAGFSERHQSWGATILHELGHVMGLDHVEDDGELMYPFPGVGEVLFGPGDQAGLQALGRDSGCLDVPDAAPIDVVYRDA